MIWRFSDGTTVELGGAVEGPTLLAQRLRERLGRIEQLKIWPPPSEAIDFDKGDPALLNFFLESELDFWTRVRELPLKLERPDGIPSLPPPPWDPATFDAEAIY